MVRSHGIEFATAALYGRPLFALMLKKGKLTKAKLIGIGDRLVLINKDVSVKLDDNLIGCLSVLGTRAQMGQSPLDVASKLIAKGFACLGNVGEHRTTENTRLIAHLFYPYDPVVDFVAMKIMCGKDDGKKLKDGWTGWSKKVTELFSTGLCMPSKGSLGEVAAALYMLFSGDVLRSKIDASMNTFSIPVQDWLQMLATPTEQPAVNKATRGLLVNFSTS